MAYLAKAHAVWIVVLALVMVVDGCGASNVNDNDNPPQGGTGGNGGSGASGGVSNGGTAGSGAGGAPSGGTSGAAGAAGVAAAGGSAGATSCHGKDDEGSCKSSTATSCPDIDQEITWLCVDPINGFVELMNSSDSRTYWCTLIFDPPDAFDCKAHINPGLSQAITSGGVPGGSCPCGSTFAIGFPNCTYDCKVRE